MNGSSGKAKSESLRSVFPYPSMNTPEIRHSVFLGKSAAKSTKMSGPFFIKRHGQQRCHLRGGILSLECNVSKILSMWLKVRN